ncbi:hypothetical protein EB73_27965 [Mycobacterium sp. SWH-M3]|nr:hypothetical protein EB73_27965 [Mycobacterium sp. SWH-M3]
MYGMCYPWLMVFNTPEFGRVARSARGELSQDDINFRGGPPRQKQAPIERGDRIELTDTLLKQIDMGYGWAPDTARALLVRPPRPSNFTQRFSNLSATALGLDQEGCEVEVPDLFITRCARDLLPIITRWPGPVLIGVYGEASQDPNSVSALVANWDLWTDDGDPHQPREHHLRAGLHTPSAASAIAVDPIVAVHGFRQVVDLFLSLARALPKSVGSETRKTLELQAFTLLFVASEARRRGLGAGLNALDDLADFICQEPSHGLDQLMRDGGWDVRSDWEAFRSQTGLSSRFDKPHAGLIAVLDGLNAIRDVHVDAELVDPWPEGLYNPDEDHDPNQAVRPTRQPAMRAITDLDGTILFYNARLCPELPVIVDWAYRNRTHPPLVVSDFHDMTKGLSRSKFIMVDHTAELDTAVAAGPLCSRLVQTSGGRGIFVPARSIPGPPEPAKHVWLSQTGHITSNRHDGSFRLPSEAAANNVLDFYHAHKASLGPILYAHHHRFTRTGPQLTLVDINGHQLRLWGPDDTRDQAIAPVITPMRKAVATILEDAGFGSFDEMIEETQTADRTRFRPNPDLSLALGVDHDHNDQLATVNASEFAVGLYISDGEAGTDLVTTAILNLCNERAPHTVSLLTLIGQPLPADSAWTSVAKQPHLLSHFSPTKTSDLDTVLEKFNSTLQEEIDRREAVPRQPGYPSMPARRQPLPHLLVAIDGFTDFAPLMDSPAFAYAAEHGKNLGIHLVLCGPGRTRDRLASYQVDWYGTTGADARLTTPVGSTIFKPWRAYDPAFGPITWKRDDGAPAGH